MPSLTRAPSPAPWRLAEGRRLPEGGLLSEEGFDRKHGSLSTSRRGLGSDSDWFGV